VCLSYHRRPMRTLRSALDSLAHTFASGVLDAIRGASIEDLLAESGGAPVRRSPGRPRGTGLTWSESGVDPIARPSRKARKTKGGRLARRSPQDIAKAVEQVVALVKKHKDGLRSEQIRNLLKLDRREVPRILTTAVASKKLKAKGQKRATTYSVGGSTSTTAKPKPSRKAKNVKARKKSAAPKKKGKASTKKRPTEASSQPTGGSSGSEEVT
jgi:hypothetical protein